ncbi:hypothetical protein EYF80_020234 [Liparis tanakae]|uniref:Uncharacterized protein n=1 Tax=Liparis tanakae TaxID=230148 RepID=A0A4Z2HUT5_9TELE|nr:hypothetical protein EYF80_020234 [Liparis tanakae]
MQHPQQLHLVPVRLQLPTQGVVLLPQRCLGLITCSCGTGGGEEEEERRGGRGEEERLQRGK